MNALLTPSAPAVHPDEWKARVQPAACYRVFEVTASNLLKIDASYKH